MNFIVGTNADLIEIRNPRAWGADARLFIGSVKEAANWLVDRGIVEWSESSSMGDCSDDLLREVEALEFVKLAA